MRVELTHELVNVTKAKRWIVERKYVIDGKELQRKVRPGHVEELTQAMLRGEMVTANCTIQFCRFDGHYYNTDGQHTLLAIVLANKRKPSFDGLQATVEIVHCESKDEVARVYATRDTGIMRTQSDAFRASGISDEFCVSEPVVNKVGAAVAILIAGFSRSPGNDNWKQRSRDIRLRVTREWMPEAKLYFEYVKTQKGMTGLLRKSSLVAVGLCLIRYQPAKAETFLKGIADTSGQSNDDPRIKLREQLLRLEALKGTTIKKEQEARYVALAWNAFYRGVALKIFKTPNPDTPIKLLGTLYDGKTVHKIQV
jgi:hypothetical protein